MLADKMMTERTRGIVMCAAMLGVQALVTWAVFVASWCMKRNWTELLGREPLPVRTVLAFRLGYAIPVLATVGCAVVLARLVMRRAIRTGDWLMAIALAEIIVIGFFTVGITEPAMFITYSMGP
jgi:hypothetical protein